MVRLAPSSSPLCRKASLSRSKAFATLPPWLQTLPTRDNQVEFFDKFCTHKWEMDDMDEKVRHILGTDDGKTVDGANIWPRLVTGAPVIGYNEHVLEKKMEMMKLSSWNLWISNVFLKNVMEINCLEVPYLNHIMKVYNDVDLMPWESVHRYLLHHHIPTSSFRVAPELWKYVPWTNDGMVLSIDPDRGGMEMLRATENSNGKLSNLWLSPSALQRSSVQSHDETYMFPYTTWKGSKSVMYNSSGAFSTMDARSVQWDDSCFARYTRWCWRYRNLTPASLGMKKVVYEQGPNLQPDIWVPPEMVNDMGTPLKAGAVPLAWDSDCYHATQFEDVSVIYQLRKLASLKGTMNSFRES